jgi:hypothetical protein
MLKQPALLAALASALLLSPAPCLGGESKGPVPTTVVLAQGGRAKQSVVVRTAASEATRRAARELADYLGRIAGATFEVRRGDGTSGLAVGVEGDFPGLSHGIKFAPDDPLRRDEYLIRTHPDGAYVIGASETAVTLAVWDLLHRLGYRLFFPTDTWEVVPKHRRLTIAVDAVERPDYVTRRAPRGAPWSDRALWDRWRRRNRVISSFQLHTGHSYGGIIRAKSEQFAAHPEYYALVDGERRLAGQTTGRGNIKFCISNPGLRQLVAEYAVGTMRAHPERDSISLDPSDGGHWCECPACKAMGSVSDRVVMLAGEAAKAVNRLGLGPKYVGIYAYSQHSPPPSLDVHPRVIVSIATSFIRGGYTLEELIDGWRARQATLGIRDYHDVFAWSHDRPRKARGGNIATLCHTVPYFHEQGARFMNSENSDSWGANGLGYWLTPRLLWNVEAAQRVDELIDDFLEKAFGPARQPMREFYTLLNRDDRVRSSEDVVARMYRSLADARRLAESTPVRRRLDDLILYTRYLELYHAYRAAKGEERQRRFERIWRHAYRMRDRRMVSTRAICQRDRFRDKAVTVPKEADWSVPADENPWKNDEPFSDGEIAAMLADGIAANQPTQLDFEPVEYSNELVPAARLGLREGKAGRCDDRFRGRHVVFTWLPEKADGAAPGAPRQVELEVTGGLIEHYRDRGNVRIALYAARQDAPQPVDRDESVPPDGKPRRVTLASPYDGLHRLEWDDGRDMTRVAWPDDLPITFRSALGDSPRLVGRWSLCCYVPRGTKTVGGFATATTGRLLDGSGSVVFSFEEMDKPDYFSVAVPEGQDGRLWRFEHCSGSRMLMTVPPYLAPSAADLLLPREVVAADAAP